MSLLLSLLLLAAGDLNAAEEALAAGRPAEALELLGDLAERRDADIRAWVVQGRAQLALGENEAAVEPLVRASEKRPEDRDLARDAALACMRSAQGAEGRLYLEDAKRLAARVGDDALLADIEFDLADYGAALALYRKGEGVHAATRVADCLKLLGRAEEAKDAYAAALEMALGAEDLGIAFRAAFAAGRGGRLLVWLDERIAARPDDLDARLYRGYARMQSQMFPEAIEDLRVYLARNPRHVGVKDKLSLALVQHGYRRQDNAMMDEAAALAREVLDSEPTNQDAWDRLSYIAGYKWDNGDLEGVYALSKDLHARDPSDARAALNFAMAARRLGRYDEARTAYDAMLEASPNDPNALNDLGILLDGLGNREEARARWEEALVEEPGNLDALENLFTDAWERGDTAAARDYARRGLAAAQEAKGPVDVVGRWLWFEDRLLWAPTGHGE